MEEKENQPQEKEKDQKKKKRMIKVTLLMILILLLLLLFFRCGKSSVVPGVVDIRTNVDLQDYVDEITNLGMFQVFINSEIQVDADNTANLLIQNHETNIYASYVEIVAEGEVLYQSELIKPGYKLETDKLTTDIKPGTYDGFAYFHIVGKDGNEVNKIGIKIKLVKE